MPLPSSLFLRVILKSSYKDYNNALETLDIETLKFRRKKLSLNFAKKCKNNTHASDLFKEKTKIHNMEFRNTEKFEINKFNTTRYQFSAVPYMQNLLNQHQEEKKAVQN